MSFDAIRFEREGAVAVVSLNRPDRLNALNSTLLKELGDAFEAIAADDGVRAVLLRGEGRAFCSGADLKDGFEAGVSTGDSLRANYHPVIECMRSLEKPIVVAVHGLAAGAGASIALAGDLIVAGRSGAFQQIFTNIGLVPDAGSTYTLPRLVGKARALGAVLTGEAIPAEQAERWGMIWQVVDDDALESAARKLAETLAARPTRALGLAKRIVEASANNELPDQLELEAATQEQCEKTNDFGEAVQAFLEKREARFTGK